MSALDPKALLPCPFCGSANVAVRIRDVEPQGDPYYGQKRERIVECDDCAAVLFNKYWHDGFYEKDDAIAAWNTRWDTRFAQALAETQEREAEKDRRIAELEAALESANAAADEPGGDYLFGLRCGVEDRCITDRYEAAEYGWQQAFNYVQSAMPDAALAQSAQPTETQ